MRVKRDVFGHARLAHSALKGVFQASKYTDGVLKRIGSPVADLRLAPNATALDRQVLYGHPVRQLEDQEGLSRDETTGYVGYVVPACLEAWSEPTHRVHVRSTLLFREPDFKSPDPIALSCGSLLTITGSEGRFACTADGHFAIPDHLTQEREPDLAATAQSVLQTPYLWGGNSAFGIDCSGLVQLACQAAGQDCPGDSDQQAEVLGQALPLDSQPQRNDLLFWPGHVALVYDAETLIHANAHRMAVTLEPLKKARARIEATDPLIALRRP